MSENEFESLEQDAINKAMKTLDSNPYISGLECINQKPELPLTRRERRALKRKEKKQKDVSSSYICVNEKTYNMLKEKELIKQ